MRQTFLVKVSPEGKDCAMMPRMVHTTADADILDRLLVLKFIKV